AEARSGPLARSGGISLPSIRGQGISSMACRLTNKLPGKSARRIRPLAPFITSASNPKPKSSFGPSRSLAAAGSESGVSSAGLKGEGDSILGGKLFGIAALAIAVIAIFPGSLTDAIFDFYVHGTYIVVAARYAILWTALLFGVFAVFYYFVDRGFGLRLNNGMSLAFPLVDFLVCCFCFGSTRA